MEKAVQVTDFNTFFLIVPNEKDNFGILDILYVFDQGNFFFVREIKTDIWDNHDCNVGRDQGPQQSTLDRIDIRQHLHRLILDQRLNRHSATGRR